MSFVNTNYEAKLSPTMQENWLVQIFKNNNTSYETDDTPDLAFSFAETTYNIANIDIDGTTLLETLSNLYINAHVNVLSQIDNDSAVNNALQIFSGKISSFGYRNNTIILDVISNRPFQSVSLPQLKTKGKYEGTTIPYILGDYTQSNFNNLSKQISDLYKVPYIRNDNDNLVFLLPNKIANNTSSINNLEFYDKNIQKFIPLSKTGFSSTTTSKLLDPAHTDGGTTVEVNSQLVKDFQVSPSDLTDHNGNELTMYSSSTLSSSSFTNGANAFDLNSDGTFNDTTFATVSAAIAPADDSTPGTADRGGVSLFLKFPKPMHKLTNFQLRMRYEVDIVNSNGSSGFKLYIHSDDLSSEANIADETNAGFFKGGTGSTIQTSDVAVNNQTISLDSTKFDDIFKNNAIQDRLRLTLRLFSDEPSQGQFDDFSCTLKIYSISATYTTTLETTTETIAKQESNANISELYLSEPITTSDFNGHTATNDNLNNPVAIHRQIIKDFVGIDSLATDADNVNNGYKAVADIRDSDASPHWKTRLEVYDQTSLESIMNRLQYEGCFFFQYSPQAQQATTISGASILRYFTIENSVNANVDLSQNDISNYQIAITPAQDLETNLVVNYKPHPAESKYLKQDTFIASNHTTIFGSNDVQKQEINLQMLYDAVDDVVGSRNSSWINFRKSLFGDYKTIVSASIINPEKYAMLQVGDYIDFGEILFSELGSPFDEISDTFDSFVAMPTRLFNEAWSGKKFIITSLKRKVGQVDVQCREV